MSIAHNLGLQVIAEGIETAADRDILAGMGCPFGQGFLYFGPAEHRGRRSLGERPARRG